MRHATCSNSVSIRRSGNVNSGIRTIWTHQGSMVLWAGTTDGMETMYGLKSSTGSSSGASLSVMIRLMSDTGSLDLKTCQRTPKKQHSYSIKTKRRGFKSRLLICVCLSNIETNFRFSGRLEETLCFQSFQLPNFQLPNSYEDQKRKFNTQTCLNPAVTQHLSIASAPPSTTFSPEFFYHLSPFLS